jgi:N-acetylmuramoyl-L-alanine amidase
MTSSDFPSPLFRALRHIGIVVLVAAAAATIFTMWSPSSLLPAGASQAISQALATRVASIATAAPLAVPTAAAPTHPLIGIVAGHSGPQNDPGAVCPDGLTERGVNTEVANRVKGILEGAGYTVDVLNEFDDRLVGYRAAALVSIHSDSCEYINEFATGFKVARALYDQVPERSDKLVSCLTDRYQKRTEMNFHAGSITPDMTSYHGFNEIAAETPAAIIEVGFLNLDRDMFTNHPDLVAQGVAEGVLCFVRNEG